MNGITLKQDQLTDKRIAVVSLVGNSLSYKSQRFINSVDKAVTTPSWDLDGVFAWRLADALTSTLNVPTSVYAGSLNAKLMRIYVDHPIAVAYRFDWGAVADDFKAIARENHADFVAVLMREEYQDLTAMSQFFVKGLGVAYGQRVCSAFANLTLTVIDGNTGQPVAGANVYAAMPNGRVLSHQVEIPMEFCDQQLQGLSEQQWDFLHRLYLALVNPAMLRQTAGRLVSQ
jgi:hypothetical protein